MLEALLEFKAKDGAWYAGTATFESPFLRVHFEHFSYEEDERWLPTKFKTPQEVKKMIRPASQPMQDYHCGSLHRGVFVCVACRQPPSECFEYYDAKLQQIQRSPHTLDRYGQECCKCTFEVEWLEGPLVHKRQFVTCGDICHRTPGDIEDDPVIKEYLAEVNRCKITKTDFILEKNALPTSQKRKALSSPDKIREHVSQQSVSVSGYNGFDTSGETSNQTRDDRVKKEKHIEKQSVQESCNGIVHMKSSEPEPSIISQSLPESSQPLKKPMDVIEIDSDKEEDCKPSPRSSHIQTGQTDDLSANKSVPNFDCSKAIPNKDSPCLDDGCSTHHECLENRKEQMCAYAGDASACSCAPWPRHCHTGGTCGYKTMGFVPITPFHVMHTCTHSMHGHGNMNSASNWGRSDNVCIHLATSQVSSQVADSQAAVPACKKYREESNDIKHMSRCHKAISGDWFFEAGKGLTSTQFLLVQNIEKDVIPFKALKVLHRITCDALTIYIWPTLDYETTRKGYICYQNCEAAEAAFQKLSAENVFIASSKGRPWVISKTHLQELDLSQMYSISAPVARKHGEAIEQGKEEQDGEFIILHKGTEMYNMARRKQKLFVEQQKKLRLCFQQFTVEDEELETLL